MANYHSNIELNGTGVSEKLSRAEGLPCSARHWHCALYLLLVSTLMLTGCRGCFTRTEEKLSPEELEKRRRERAEAIQVMPLVSLPYDGERKAVTVKPGHWHETQQKFKSNREDLQVVVSQSLLRGGEQVTVPGTNTINDYTRRTSLPKGQTKTVELQSFVPTGGTGTDPDTIDFGMKSTRLQYSSNLLSWPLMTPLRTAELSPTNELKNHEFQLVVASPQALAYEHLTVLDAVLWRKDEQIMEDQQIRSYHVSLVKPENNRYELPRSFLTMTSVAVLLWDDVAPDDLSTDQQHALIDWLHWGGQLVISGPSSWSRLQNSFLSPYLPATTAETVELTTENFRELSDHWVVEDVSSRRATRDPLEIVGSPVAGLRFQLNPQGLWLPHSGELVAEAQVGRGRVVMTSFPLREQRIYRWKYYGSFFSTGLLRRPPRTVLPMDGNALAQSWAAPFDNRNREPGLNSNVRLLSRDLPLGTSSLTQSVRLNTPSEEVFEPAEAAIADDIALETETLAPPLTANPQTSVAPPREELAWNKSGASWDDNSGLCQSAGEALRLAAGIELPARRTILYLLGGYLMFLVPLNWLFFRSIRRLEYAWIAAPIMALIGVAVVTKVASLDIGFARRTTEISVLEMHANYPRGHLTKFLALYTSLSTNYVVDFPETDSVALPMDLMRVQLRAAPNRKNMRTTYGRSEGARLEPVTVYSNSTEMLHAEQIIPLPGDFSLGTTSSSQPALKNSTGLSLRSALVVRCQNDGSIEQAWIGDLGPSDAVPLEFATCSRDRLGAKWNDATMTKSTYSNIVNDETDSLWIGQILQGIVKSAPLYPGQSRLIGFTDDRLGELTITPTEDQLDARCVVVVHLTAKQLEAVVPDQKVLGRSVIDIEDSVQPEAGSEEEVLDSY